jgi:hypothetical protein
MTKFTIRGGQREKCEKKKKKEDKNKKIKNATEN